MKLSNNKGVTFAEILVVLAVVSILTTVATISISVVNNANVSRAMTSLQSGIASARAQSMAKGRDAAFINIYTKANGGLYYKIGPDPTEEIRVCDSLITVSALSDGVQYGVNNIYAFYENTAINTKIYFNSAGMPSTDTGALVTEFFFKRGNRYGFVYMYNLTGKTETGIYYY